MRSILMWSLYYNVRTYSGDGQDKNWPFAGWLLAPVSRLTVLWAANPCLVHCTTFSSFIENLMLVKDLASRILAIFELFGDKSFPLPIKGLGTNLAAIFPV